MPDAWLVYVPAARSPHKPRGPAAQAIHRIEMLRLATEHLRNCTIWTDEIDRAQAGAEPSYWITTLERAKTAHPAPIRFLIGSDQALAFHRWQGARRILSLAEPIVMLRAPHATADELIKEMTELDQWTESELSAWRDRIYEGLRFRAASTDVREHTRGARRLMDPKVESYIKQHALYD
jgi:nicotinate-nucleotide adenylyltransferase